MNRTQVAVALWLSVVPSSLFAQFELAGRGGVHVDRASERDRLVTDGGAAMYAERGEASARRAASNRLPVRGLPSSVSRAGDDARRAHVAGTGCPEPTQRRCRG